MSPPERGRPVRDFLLGKRRTGRPPSAAPPVLALALLLDRRGGLVTVRAHPGGYKSINLKSAALACAVLFTGAAAHSETIYLTAARMVDPAAGRVTADPAVVIEGDKVTAVGTAAALAAPAGARRIDLAGKTILPGLIDMHTHITARSDMAGYQELSISVPAEAISGVANARKTLQAGFTTLRNVGADGFTDVALRDSINSGESVGPRLFVSGPLIGATGGHCDENLLPASYHATEMGWPTDRTPCGIWFAATTSTAPT